MTRTFAGLTLLLLAAGCAPPPNPTEANAGATPPARTAPAPARQAVNPLDTGGVSAGGGGY